MVRRDDEVSVSSAGALGEDWFALLVQSLGDALIACDRSGGILTMNASAESLTGWHREEAAGEHWKRLCEFESEGLCPVARAMCTGAVTQESRVPVSLPRLASKITASLSVSSIQDSHGCVHGAVFLLRDITHVRRMEEQYQRARHLEGMQRLAEGLAHNLNNLITVIAGYSEALVWSLPDSTPEHRNAALIRAASDEAGALIHKILAFSRYQPAQARRLDLNSIVASVEQVLAPQLGAGIIVEKSLDPDLCQIESDPGHVEQIVMTLLLNARDAVSHGGTIRIRTAKFDFSEQLACNYPDIVTGKYALLEVSDDGAGIDYAAQAGIFEPFFTTKNPEKAAGLSLAALYGLVKHASGHVDFESAPRAGSRFRVFLPAAPDPAAVSIDSLSERRSRSMELVLLVEDQPETRLLTAKLLVHLGYDVLEASNGAEALHLLNEYGADVRLLLTDIIMPGIGGVELAQRVTEMCPGIKVLFLSAFSQYALKHHGALIGSAQILQKPITTRTLAEKVREVLDERSDVLD
ncbi:MAG: response regulator [Bryobacteraceae bacterium]